MKTITLTQPWATLVAIGAKKIETRSWSTSYRGPLAIHAAKGLGSVGGKRAFWRLEQSRPFSSVLRPADFPNYDTYPEGYPFGAVVATCELESCLLISGWQNAMVSMEWFHEKSQPIPAEASQEYAFGDYTPGRYAWLLTNVRRLPEPIPAKGALSLWEWIPPEGVL